MAFFIILRHEAQPRGSSSFFSIAKCIRFFHLLHNCLQNKKKKGKSYFLKALKKDFSSPRTRVMTLLAIL